MKKLPYKLFFITCAVFCMFFGFNQVKAAARYDTYCEYTGNVVRTDKLDANGQPIEEPVIFRVLINIDGSLDYTFWAQKYTMDAFSPIGSGYVHLDSFGDSIAQSLREIPKGNKLAIYCPKEIRIEGFGVPLPESPDIQFTLKYWLKQNGDSDPTLYNAKLTKEVLAEKFDVDSQTGEIKKTIGDTTTSLPDDEETGPVTGCDIFGGKDSKTSELIRTIITIIRFAIPILVVILGIMDFFGVLFSGEEKNFKEAGTRFLKRMIAGILIIFVPSILNFLLNISGILDTFGITDLFCGF